MPAKKKPAATTAAATPMTTAQATVAALHAGGVNTVYGVPGVHNDHLFDALAKASDSVTTIHTRHEQGGAYMALGAAMATGKPQAYAAVPGPGLLNSAAALLTAYGTNSPVIGLIGHIPQPMIGRGIGWLHEIRDQFGIIERLVDHAVQIKGPAEAPRIVADLMRKMGTGRPGPAVIECAMDIWGKSAAVPPILAPVPAPPPVDEDAVLAAAKKLGAAKRPLIYVGGGAQGASAEVTRLAHMLQAPVISFRRGRGVLDARDPLSVNTALGRELWGEADVVIGIGTHLFYPFQQWGVDKDLAILRIDIDAEEPDRVHKSAVAMVGDAKPILRRLLDVLPSHNAKRPSRTGEMNERQARLRAQVAKQIPPQLAILEAIRAELPEDGLLVEEITQMGFAARVAFPVYKPNTYLSPGYQDNLGWGFATALGAAHARPDVPVLSINGDGGFMFTANEMATAIRHRIPLTAVVFNDGAFGNVRRIQQEMFGNRVIASDLANPDFVKFAESFGAAAERAKDAKALRAALKRGFARRDGPTLIEVPVGPMPSPWEFIHMPKVRG